MLQFSIEKECWVVFFLFVPWQNMLANDENEDFRKYKISKENSSGKFQKIPRIRIVFN